MDTVTLPEGMTYTPIDNDTYVLHVDRMLSNEQREALVETLTRALPGKKVIVLDSGMNLQRVPSIEVVESIEQKLDLLIAMLLDEEEQPDHTALEDDSDVMDNQDPQSL